MESLAHSPATTLRDVIALTKPRITLMVVITAAAGMWVALRTGASGPIEFRTALLVVFTIAAVVAGANSLNCWLERDSDRHMERTRLRPLPDGRLDPKVALVLGLLLGLASVPMLAFGVNPLTGLLGALALVVYVAIYTPMKPISTSALLVGAVPGALPPLMGYTAMANRIDAAGLALFGILFLWQVPHFIAISIFRQEEYERAGLKVLPSVRGLEYAKLQAALYAALLAPVSLLPFALHFAGPIYLIAALVLGVGFVGLALAGLRPSAGRPWARQLFVASLVYLTVLLPVLMLDTRG